MSTSLPIPAANVLRDSAIRPLAISPANPVIVDSSNIHYYARSFGDPRSRLFWHGRDLHLGVMPPYGHEVGSFLHSQVFRELQSEALFSDLAESQLNPGIFEATYRLGTTPRIIYWHEWSSKMLHAGALRILKLLVRLARHKLTLRNPHPWNLLFDGRRFTYINPGSVVSLDMETFGQSYEKVARHFVRPLLLMEHGYGHTAQLLVRDMREGALAADVRHLNCDWSEWSGVNRHLDAVSFLEMVVENLGALVVAPVADRWIDYFATDCDFGPGTSWTRKQETLLSLLEDKEIRSVLDLGANTGHYAKLAAGLGREVLATDFDPALVDAIYSGAAAEGLALYPAVLDFVYPPSPGGVDYRWFPPATERYSGDLVLCFALAHHLVFGRYRLDFEQIARGIRSYSRAWALVEYVERGKIQPAEWRPDADIWYSVEAFATVLRRHFPVVDVLPAANDGRRLLVCGPYRRSL